MLSKLIAKQENYVAHYCSSRRYLTSVELPPFSGHYAPLNLVVKNEKEEKMIDCCSTAGNTNTFPKKHICPVNGKAYGLISPVTIKHHIKAPWLWAEKRQGYYFCSDPDCEVVYFGQDDSVIEKSSVRTEIGAKEKSMDGLICYCYGISRSEAQNNPLSRQFVIEETKHQRCACETRNPSGKCCLEGFPKK